MIINKESKVFGLINIIDLLIIVLLIASGIFFAGRVKSGEITIIQQPTTSPYEMRFFVESVQDFTVEKMRVGDELFDDQSNVSLGVIVELNQGPSIEWNPNSSGVLVNSPKEGWSSLEVVTHVNATPYEHGVRIAGNPYSVGHSMTIRAGGKIFLRVSGIEERGVEN